MRFLRRGEEPKAVITASPAPPLCAVCLFVRCIWAFRLCPHVATAGRPQAPSEVTVPKPDASVWVCLLSLFLHVGKQIDGIMKQRLCKLGICGYNDTSLSTSSTIAGQVSTIINYPIMIFY